jgi:glycerol-3-phosphate acyltransferase PlsY
MEIKSAAAIIFSYLLGCFNTGYYYTRLFYQKDIRSVGTNVTGATNVGRVAGKKGFVITFLGDAGKGAFAVILGRLLGLGELTVLLSVLMVIAGHIFPLQLKFKGGKGISTLIGAFITYNPILVLFLLATCIVIYPFVRQYTVTSLFALCLFPIELFIAGFAWWKIIIFALCSIIILYACRNNLRDYKKPF